MTDLEEKDILESESVEVPAAVVENDGVNHDETAVNQETLETPEENMPPEVEEQIMNATSALVLEADANRA